MADHITHMKVLMEASDGLRSQQCICVMQVYWNCVMTQICPSSSGLSTVLLGQKQKA